MVVCVACIVASASATASLSSASTGPIDHPSHRLPACSKRSNKHKKHRCRLSKKKTALSQVKNGPQAASSPTASGPRIEESEGSPGKRPPTESPCVSALPPALPEESGWVRGSFGDSGGPFGDSACGPGPVTVVVSNSSGVVAASQHVAEREEWAIPLPPGTYSLAAFDGEGKRIECESYPAIFTVVAGQAVQDNVSCDIP
jgi:hypothetical protein